MTPAQSNAGGAPAPGPEQPPLDGRSDWEGFRLDLLSVNSALSGFSGAISNAVTENPVPTAMLSLAFGVLVGLWIGRRCRS